jgi:hypothetical protein
MRVRSAPEEEENKLQRISKCSLFQKMSTSVSPEAVAHHWSRYWELGQTFVCDIGQKFSFGRQFNSRDALPPDMTLNVKSQQRWEALSVVVPALVRFTE